MQIAENWARIAGRIEAWDPPAKPDGSGILTIRVDSVNDIQRAKGIPYKNLLKDDEGRALRVLITSNTALKLKPAIGARVELDVRRGRSADHVFARPEPFRSS